MEFSGIGIVLFLGALLLSMAFHEAMHAFMSHWLGDDTAYHEGRLTLNPLAHIDLITTIAVPLVLVLMGLPPILAAKPVPFNPYRVRFEEFGAALVGLAGPVSNLLLAIATAGILRAGNFMPSSLMVDALVTLLQVNVALFVFNMIPIPPLDGSRVLYAFAPDPVRRVMEQIESIGILGIMMILFLLLPVLGPFITEANQSLLRVLL